jgi:taurine dioxygenase
LKTEADPHNFGGVWHTNQVFAAKPAMGATLFAKEIPDAGGDTLFANMCAAYDASYYTMQSMMSGLKGICIVDRKPYLRAERYKDLKGVKLTQEKCMQRQSEHPLVCAHPEPVGNPGSSARMWKPSPE